MRQHQPRQRTDRRHSSVPSHSHLRRTTKLNFATVEAARYDASLCGQTVSVTNVNNGLTVSAIVADMCPGCANSESLDLSVGAWLAIGETEADGSEVPITWTLVN